MLLPTIMLIALAFISCGGDDDNEETGGSSSNDYIEITLNGKLIEIILNFGLMCK